MGKASDWGTLDPREIVADVQGVIDSVLAPSAPWLPSTQADFARLGVEFKRLRDVAVPPGVQAAHDAAMDRLAERMRETDAILDGWIGAVLRHPDHLGPVHRFAMEIVMPAHDRTLVCSCGERFRLPPMT